MRILIVMDPGILVPPKGYGGIERIVEIMANEYLAMGHEVHLLCTTGSYVEGCVMHPFGRAVFPQEYKDVMKAIPYAWNFLWKHRNDFDLIHNFGRLAYLIPLLNHPVKKIMSYQREISNRNIQVIDFLRARNLIFSACSSDLMSRLKKKNGAWAAVYNAIHFSKYTVTENLPKDAPLIFLGRIEKVKGCHTAIALAKATGENLIIAGNISPLPEEREYFEKEIQPHIDDKQIRYVGVLDDQQKDFYLGQSKAMVFPIHWNEPFGIVMIEAMACGTPVIGYNKGSVEEVIDEGITGYKVEDFEGMVRAVKKLDGFNRLACREKAAERFDASVIAAQYLSLFDQDPQQKKIVIVTTGQPATNPRIMKEYEALKEKGYAVKVLYTYSADWAHAIDKVKFDKGILKYQDFILIGGDPHNKKVLFFLSRLFLRIFKMGMLVLPFRYIKDMAMYRASFFIWHQAHKYKADLYMAHYLGALPGATRAAKKNNAACMFDAEDFHRGEPVYYPEQNRHIIEVEDRYLPAVSYVTTASPLITLAYKKLYPGQRIETLNNVFSSKYLQQPKEPGVGPLKLFWFSQNIGPNRGLEVIIDALNIVGTAISLYLLGNAKNPQYLQSLQKRIQPPADMHLLKPVDPDQIFKVAANYDIGLASEVPHCENRNICLTNKIFTYLLAGNCVLASDTDAQRLLLDQYKGIGLVYKHNDADDLAMKIREFINNKEKLRNCKIHALEVVRHDLNWEREREKLYAVVETVLKEKAAW
jgi:glycosyltransferase involved in cell wall biosynthesis